MKKGNGRHFPKVSFRGCSWGFVFFTSAIWEYSYSNMILQPDFVRNRNFPCFFVVANLNHCRSKNSEKEEKKHRRRSQFACDLTCHR